MLLIAVWILGNIIALSVYYSPYFIKENWREAAAYVESGEREGDAIIFNPSYLGFPFDYYYSGGLPRGSIETTDAARRLKEIYPSIWLIESSSYLAAPSGHTRHLIEGLFIKEKEIVFKGYSGDILITKFY